MQLLALIFMGLLRRPYHLMARHRWTVVLVFAGLLIGLGYCVAGSAEARKIRWTCATWESHNEHFEPAAHFNFIEATRQVGLLRKSRECRAYDFWFEVTPVAAIGEAIYRGDVVQAWMVRLASGAISYAVWIDD